MPGTTSDPPFSPPISLSHVALFRQDRRPRKREPTIRHDPISCSCSLERQPDVFLLPPRCIRRSSPTPSSRSREAALIGSSGTKNDRLEREDRRAGAEEGPTYLRILSSYPKKKQRSNCSLTRARTGSTSNDCFSLFFFCPRFPRKLPGTLRTTTHVFHA